MILKFKQFNESNQVINDVINDLGNGSVYSFEHNNKYGYDAFSFKLENSYYFFKITFSVGYGITLWYGKDINRSKDKIQLVKNDGDFTPDVILSQIYFNISTLEYTDFDKLIPDVDKNGNPIENKKDRFEKDTLNVLKAIEYLNYASKFDIKF
jgi:hypothetical protein